jgi:hypothetical protein
VAKEKMAHTKRLKIKNFLVITQYLGEYTQFQKIQKQYPTPD